MNQIACAQVMVAALYVRGEIDGSAAEQSYEEHFMDCGDCLRAVELWRALAQGLRTAAWKKGNAERGRAAAI